MSEQVNTALEEAKTALDEVSETVKTEKETKKSKTETKKVSEKSGERDSDSPKNVKQVLTKEERKKRSPVYKVSELVSDSRKNFKCTPEVATIAFRQVGKVNSDTLNVLEAKKIVKSFLKKEVN